ncbi:ARS binding protein 2-domain-containing protein [Dipodascopsis uninucleata]
MITLQLPLSPALTLQDFNQTPAADTRIPDIGVECSSYPSDGHIGSTAEVPHNFFSHSMDSTTSLNYSQRYQNLDRPSADDGFQIDQQLLTTSLPWDSSLLSNAASLPNAFSTRTTYPTPESYPRSNSSEIHHGFKRRRYNSASNTPSMDDESESSLETDFDHTAIEPESMINNIASADPDRSKDIDILDSLSSYSPSDRELPKISLVSNTAKDVEGRLGDAYVQFILYCNPAIPLSIDTSELRRVFSMVPRSDGKAFQISRLLDLLRLFDYGEIKTWTQLVTDLGVQRQPDQSAQKIQQYAVRLKRWMRAMHIDSFFEYCMQKPHAYYKQVPDPRFPTLAIRDGVPLEEDLAIKALFPTSKIRRTRKSSEMDATLSGDEHSVRSFISGDHSPADMNSSLSYSTTSTTPSSTASANTSSYSSSLPSKNKRHGPAVSSSWISQEWGGRGRPSHYVTAQCVPTSQRHVLLEADKTEDQLRQVLSRKLATSSSLRDVSHASIVASRAVKDIRSELASAGAGQTGSSFAWIFGGLVDIQRTEFDITVITETFGSVVYELSWKIKLGATNMFFRRSVQVP